MSRITRDELAKLVYDNPNRSQFPRLKDRSLYELKLRPRNELEADLRKLNQPMDAPLAEPELVEVGA